MARVWLAAEAWVATTLHARSRPAQGEALRIEGMGGTLGRWKQPILRLPPARVGAQNVPQLGGEHDVALTVTFAVAEEDQPPRAIDVAHFQLPQSGGADAGGIRRTQYRTMLQVDRRV